MLLDEPHTYLLTEGSNLKHICLHLGRVDI
jgi:hypothetical protein